MKYCKWSKHCPPLNKILLRISPGWGEGGRGGGDRGTQGKFGSRCAAEARKPRPCLRQKRLISLPCLRQEILLSDPDLLCFAYRRAIIGLPVQKETLFETLNSEIVYPV